MTDAAAQTTDALTLGALRAAQQPLGAAAVLKAVRDATGVRLARPTLYGSLNRLTVRSLAAYVDDAGHPRRWVAVPQETTGARVDRGGARG